MTSVDGRPAVKDLVIFLVHGTWARMFLGKTKPWFEDGSFFRDALERKILDDLKELRSIDLSAGLHFEAVTWSGENSFFARERAADSLVERIRAVKNERPGAHFFFIGHSHGGNVILRAIRKLNLRAFVPDVITMATPFVDVETQVGPERIVAYRFQSISILLSLAALLISTTVWGSNNDIVLGLAMWVGLILLLVVIFAYKRLDFVQNPYTSSIRDMAQQSSASYGHLRVLRGYDDEATLALIFGRIGSRLSSILINRLSRLTWWTTPFLGFSGVLVLLAWQSSPALGWFAALSLLFYAMLGIISEMTSATVGRELLRGALQFYVAVNSVPSFGGTTSVAATIYPRNEAGLRHALYNNEDCIRGIGEWIYFRYSDAPEGSFEGRPGSKPASGVPRAAPADQRSG